jgi:NADH dehydrogenase
MPVSVYDVARVFTESLDKPETAGKVFEVGGPQTLTLNAIDREIAAAIGKPRKPLVHFPLWWGRFLAGRFEWLARKGWIADPPLTRDQLRSLERDNTADISETVAVFGGPWREFRPGIREYLSGAKKHDPRFGFGARRTSSRSRSCASNKRREGNPSRRHCRADRVRCPQTPAE